MSNGNGRKAHIREYADNNGVSYTAALREFERVDALFAQFKTEWVKFSDYPIRVDEHFDVLISVNPERQEPFEVDWDDLESTGKFREIAFDMAIEFLPAFMGQAGIEKYDWPAHAVDSDDDEARQYRVGNRIELTYRRLYGNEISMTAQGDGTTDAGSTYVWFLDEGSDTFVSLDSPDLADIEARGAYEEVAQQIKLLADIEEAEARAADDDEPEHVHGHGGEHVHEHGLNSDPDDDDDVEWTPIDYSDPDWAKKVTAPQFFAEQRFSRAAGILHADNIAVLDRDKPGWYDSWLNADPLSNNGYRRRNAVCAPIVPKDTMRVLNHPEDAIMEFEVLATGKRLSVEMSGTDEEMRQQARDAVAKLSS